MNRRVLTVAEKLKIATLSKAGKRQRFIARELGITPRQVRRFQRESNLPIRTNALPGDVVKKIVQLTSEGVAQNKICRKLGIHQITCHKYQRLHREGTA
jgi:DNA-binding CsgD family transcriptional regulator